MHELFREEHARKYRYAIHAGQTEKFPHVSSRGHKHQMFLYHVDSTSIWEEAMKNRPEGMMILARDRALTRMKATGFTTIYQVLDNTCLALYNKAITDSGMTYKRVPSDNH